MAKYKLILINLLLISFLSCNKEETATTYIKINPNEDYVVFGHTGLCDGLCPSVYLLTNSNLRKRAGIHSDLSNEVFLQEALPNEKFILAKESLLTISDEIFDIDYSTNHCSNIIADSYIYFSGKIDGNEFKINCDLINDEAPESLKQYYDKVREVLENL